jgi:hypothetical protein
LNSGSSLPTDAMAAEGVHVIKASCIGSTAHRRLGQGGEATVHGVFDGAINLVLPGGIVSLVPESAGRGPLNVTLPRPIWLHVRPYLGLKAGDLLAVRDSSLEIGDNRISFGAAKIYSPRLKLDGPILPDSGIAANEGTAKKTALRFGNLSGLGGLLALVGAEKVGDVPGKLNLFATAAFSRIVRLERAFMSEDEGAMTVAVRDLIGLGPGLTPSSDDALAGIVLLSAVYARNHRCRVQANRLIAKVVAAEAEVGTTALSGEYLRQAALGKGNEQVIGLCTAMLTGSAASVELRTKSVLALGETSGTDTVLGIVLGSMLCRARPLSMTPGDA